MWRRNRLTVPDDLDESRAMRREAVSKRTDAIKVRMEHNRKAPGMHLLAQGLIDRLPENHFIETLYPKGLR